MKSGEIGIPELLAKIAEQRIHIKQGLEEGKELAKRNKELSGMIRKVLGARNELAEELTGLNLIGRTVDSGNYKKLHTFIDAEDNRIEIPSSSTGRMVVIFEVWGEE